MSNTEAGPSYAQQRIKLCLAASGGGHLRQLFDLEPGWSEQNSFFVTERSVLGEGLRDRHRVHFVQHYAFGQLRMGNPLPVIWNMFRNLIQAIRIVAKERPDVVVTTGAAAVFWVCVLSRFLGARLVIIESFARFDAPSVSGRLMKPFASDVIVQSEGLKRTWPDALLFDPFKIVEGTPPPKQPFTFATVGATLPFDRMVDAVVRAWEAGLFPGRLLVQTGKSEKNWVSQPDKGLEFVESLEFETLKNTLKGANLVIGHGGTGTIITALREGCRVVAMPRRHDLGEVYDDHQIEIVETFAQRGLVDAAMDADQLIPAIKSAQKRAPIMATTQPDALIAWLKSMLETIRPR